MKLKKSSKGITLIALVITIIVLLILAGVAIATLTGDNGVLTKAASSKEKTTEAEAREAVQLEAIGSIDNTGKFNYEDFKTNVKKNLGVQDKDIKDNGNGTCTVTYKGYDVTINTITGKVTTVVKSGETIPGGDDYEPGVIVTGTENKEYTDNDGETAVIPVGYGVIPGLDDISEGLVITDHFDEEGNSDGNEFVWIPVPTAISNTEANGTTNKAMAINLETDPTKEPKYRGLLYNFDDSDSTVMEGCTTNVGSSYSDFREPDIVSVYDNDTETYLSDIGLTQASFQTEMQQAYNDMIKSVNINNGFYISRYEMSLDGDENAQSKKGKESATASSVEFYWYGLYNKTKNYALKTDTTKNVVSSMLWGSQYDAMMNWMQKEGVKVNNSEPIEGAEVNQSTETGSKEEDKIKNVYDLLGNTFEWTLEACNTDYRSVRGGCNYTFESLATRMR